MQVLDLCQERPLAEQQMPTHAGEVVRLHPVLSMPFVAGMPELNACGLSETWLQKACGSQHWQSLSRSLGQPPERWVDTQGRRVYAAFGWLRMRDAELDQVEEGQALQIDSRLRWLGRSQAWSQHQLFSGGQTLAGLDMLSVFVSRHVCGNNHTVRRADMPVAVLAGADPEATALLARLRQWRQAAEGRVPAGPSSQFKPCPRSDFNGAGLLYFPSFCAFADRALWGWGRLAPTDRVVRRESLFLSTVTQRETVQVNLLEDRCAGRLRDVRLQMVCADDARPLAEMHLLVAAR
ncbi:MAG TPA: hypothetical protein DCY64_08510 [Hydrogenophaga sp.]|uniref:Pnap_2097 family protein n=1 Tax=Hydrogenophaga sp. TaxID=1904254 RepID=UPI0008C976BA|nr:Pnap_2097 family protein [Hydrogenophaga sp.]OGA73866.1 MAG: hypothetical protein A2X73_23755 [Burkholderiales bacterium GWE1_65_30]OGA92034.1 MAG: hypothetical protein A2X72_24155 [Burkholderiales bacterium GWF1_66_17]HAX20310.1 hypothetical protein [Hydrogenophaga sp.]HBU18918.1 hypothetical protein [Hydrogenophaga sp.]